MISFMIVVVVLILLYVLLNPMITGVTKQKREERQKNLIAGLDKEISKIMDAINGEEKSHTKVAKALNELLRWQLAFKRDSIFIYDYLKPKLKEALQVAEDQDQKESQKHLAFMFHHLSRN